MNKPKRMNFTVDKESERKLRELKNLKGLNMSDLVRRMIENYYEKEVLK